MADETPEQPVLVDRQGPVATVTLNRPDRGNGLNQALKSRLLDALGEVAADESVRAVVLTGAGRSFCVGQDLVEHAAALEADAAHALDTVVAHYNPIVTSLATMPKPVVAAINGACVGAGLGFALACDLRITAEVAKFGTAFSAIGLTADSGVSATLARAVGGARAVELLLLAEPFDAEQASTWGIAGRLVPSDELASAAAELANRLAAGPTRAYAEIKQALAAGWGSPLDAVLAGEGTAQARLGLTDDHRAAVTAFLAKQQPTFTGR